MVDMGIVESTIEVIQVIEVIEVPVFDRHLCRTS